MSWRESAACKGKPSDWWFPDWPVRREQRSTINAAVAICHQCSVQEECLNYSLEWEQAGIWGGMVERRRAALRREKGIILRSTVDVVFPVKRQRKHLDA